MSQPRPGPPQRTGSWGDPRSETPVSSSSCRPSCLRAWVRTFHLDFSTALLRQAFRVRPSVRTSCRQQCDKRRQSWWGCYQSPSCPADSRFELVQTWHRVRGRPEPNQRTAARSLALLAHPRPDVRRAMQRLDASCFAGDEKTHDGAINERHLTQVEREPRAVCPDLSPEFVQVLGLDVPNESERRRSAVGRCFDHEGHVLRSTIMGGPEASAAPRLTTSESSGAVQRGCRLLSNCRMISVLETRACRSSRL